MAFIMKHGWKDPINGVLMNVSVFIAGDLLEQDGCQPEGLKLPM